MNHKITNTGHKIGAMYRSHYWRCDYRVIGRSHQWEGKGVRVWWIAARTETEHLTPVGKDSELIICY